MQKKNKFYNHIKIKPNLYIYIYIYIYINTYDVFLQLWAQTLQMEVEV